MISAEEARNKIDDKAVYEYKKVYIEARILQAIELGFTATDVVIELTSVRQAIVKELKDLGYSISETDTGLVSISF